MVEVKFMPITTFSSRTFNQHINEAKKAAAKGPVIITDRGKPSHVLLNITDYERITGSLPKIADLLTLPGVEEIELNLPRLSDPAQAADLS
jgi:prevent-host-death family protein